VTSAVTLLRSRPRVSTRDAAIGPAAAIASKAMTLADLAAGGSLPTTAGITAPLASTTAIAMRFEGVA
jgi:hypothetical protein